MKLRLATPSDIPAIIQLQEQIWEPTYRPILGRDQIDYMFAAMYSPEALLEQMTTMAHTFVLIETQEGGQEPDLRGFASFGIQATDSLTAKLYKIYVLPTTQGSGLGKKLLQEVEERCLALGAETLLLNVNRYNKALNFYLKQGFQILKEEDIAFGPYWMNDYIMSKPLVK